MSQESFGTYIYFQKPTDVLANLIQHSSLSKSLRNSYRKIGVISISEAIVSRIGNKPRKPAFEVGTVGVAP